MASPSNAVSVLQMIRIDSKEQTVLQTFDHLIEAPNWLPNGHTLLYNSGGGLRTFDLTSKISEKLYTGFATRCNNDHVVSPDGKWVGISHAAEEDGLSRVYIVPLSGGKPRLITPVGPSYLHGWSPDGKTLAYCAQRDGKFDIYTISVEGGEETRLTNTPGLNDGPEYSPDGKHIWFHSMRSGLMQVWRMNADGTGQAPMTCHTDKNSWFPHLSPDGKTVAYIAYHKGDVEPGEHPPFKNVELRLMDADGKNDRLLCPLFGGQGTLNVNSWSPCGKSLAFVSYELK